MKPALVVADFAGTMFLEEGAVVAAYRSAFKAFGIEASDEDIAARRGASKRSVFEELAGRTRPVDEARIIAGQALVVFEAALREEYSSGPVQEVPGAGEAARCLRGAGVRVALASGFERGLVDLLLGRLGWDELFDLTIAGNDVAAGRPAPLIIYHAMERLAVHDVAMVAVVGDTPLDLQAGMNARAGWVIGVLSGAHGVETLGATPHSHLLSSVAGLPALFGLAESTTSRPPAG
ncbi:MAG: HAD family hydrolase [Vicinamibacterales bacterium]